MYKRQDPIFTLIANDSYWGLAYVDEARAGFIAEGQRVQARLRSRPQDVFTGKVVRIGLESDRSTEERRIFIRGDNPPARVFLGEQVEFLITAATLAEALLIPEAAVHGYNGHEGTVWTLEDGRLNRRLVRFRHRTEDSRPVSYTHLDVYKRQRLEHAIAGLRLVDAIAEGTGPGAGLGDEAKRACRFVLHRLQSGQLRDIAATLTGDADTIETALALLAGDTTKLIDLMCAFYGGQGTEPASFLGNLEAELAEASELLGKCDTARAGVDQVTDALSGVLDTCQRTVPILSKAVSDIVLIGMNAGLRAARIGGGGRSLVVIAQELKQAADAIAADTRRLTPVSYTHLDVYKRQTRRGPAHRPPCAGSA